MTDTHTRAGADLAFRRNRSAMAVSAARKGRVRLAAWKEWAPKARMPLVPSVVCRELVAAVRENGADRLDADGHYLETLREATTAAGVGLTLVTDTASMWVRCAGLFADRLVDLPPHDDLERQFARVRFVYKPGGVVSVTISTASDGEHADLATAVATSLVSAANAGGVGRVGQGKMLVGRRADKGPPPGVRAGEPTPLADLIAAVRRNR